MEKINLFVQITKWLKKGIIFYYLLMGPTVVGGLLLALEFKKGSIAEIKSFWIFAIFSMSVVFVLGLFMIPVYKIVHYLGAILIQIRDNQKTKMNQFILPSEEFRLLKKYLIIQTVINLVAEIMSNDGESGRDPIAFLDYLMNKDGVKQFVIALGYFLEIANWIFPSFSYSMPLYFLGIVYVICYFYDENLKLKTELSEVI